ncbi:MAG: hypothetical protein ACOYXU_00480 [Nitrospirota bacterium]
MNEANPRSAAAPWVVAAAGLIWLVGMQAWAYAQEPTPEAGPAVSSEAAPATVPASPAEAVPTDSTPPTHASPQPASETPTDSTAPTAPPPSAESPVGQPNVPLAPAAPTAAAPPASEGPPPPVQHPVTPSTIRWSYALTMGYYQPRLSTLNRVLEDTSVTVLQDPNYLLPRNLEFPFEKRNLSVPGIEGGAVYGIDAVYHTGGPHSFALSFSGWHGETFGQDMIPLFLRSDVQSIQVPRSARYNLVLDQVFLEWRYHMLRDAKGKGVYLNVGLVGVTFAFLTMDSLVNVVDPLGQVNFASVSSDESYGWGYTTRFGVGADYPITSWLSFGGRANYVLGTIRDMSVTRHFSAGFPEFPATQPLSIQPGVPLPQLLFTPRDGETVTYAPVTTIQDIEEQVGTRRKLPLELSGWEGLIELSIRF